MDSASSTDGAPGLSTQDEIDFMQCEDFDAGQARLVGKATRSQKGLVGDFISPYWESACRRALVTGLLEMHAKAASRPSVAEPAKVDSRPSVAELARYYPRAIEGAYLEALKHRLQKLHDYCIAHTMYMYNARGGKVTVTSRPKLVFSVLSQDGSYGLYVWGQVEADYFLVSVMPEFGSELLHLLMSAFPEMEVCNHMLITWSEAIPGHNDKRFSIMSKKGKNETASEFYCLSFGPSRQMLLLDGTTVARTIDFNDGDMIAIPGVVNSKLKHQVTGPPLDKGSRVSIVFRAVSAHKVHVEESYFIKDGIKSQFAMADRRLQPELPHELLARLMPLAPEATMAPEGPTAPSSTVFALGSSSTGPEGANP